MKTIVLIALLTQLSFAQNAQNQNVVVRPAVGVVLQSTPYGDCRQQFYNQGFTLQNQAFTCNVSNGVWTPVSGTGFVYIGVLANIPATCTVGQLSFITDATAGQNQYNCTVANTWTQNSGGGSSSLVVNATPVTGGTNGYLLYDNAGVLGATSLAGAGIQPLFALSALNYSGATDDVAVQAAVTDAAAKNVNAIIIPAKSYGSNVWLFSNAVTLPSNMTVYISNTTIQLSNSGRDNLFRSANVGFGITSFTYETNINIIGLGNAILSGAAIPRATGDNGKTLSLTPSGAAQSYGTDAGGSQTQVGDWRNYSILFGYVNTFQVRNLTFVSPGAWTISFERSENGVIDNLYMNANDTSLNGFQNLNQDGVDIRLGCNNILISNIYGTTGDDSVAISLFTHATDTPPENPGTYGISQVTGDILRSPASLDYIHDITVSHIKTSSYFPPSIYGSNSAHSLRINGSGANTYNILVDDIEDVGNASQNLNTVYIGANVASTYGQAYNISINNVVSPATAGAVYVEDSLINSSITNVTATAGSSIGVNSANQGISNVVISGLNPAYPSPVTNLLVYWPINEGSSTTVYDYGPNTLNGTINGTGTAYSVSFDPTHTPTQVGSLNGTDNTVTSSSATLKPASLPISISAWVNFTTLPGGQFPTIISTGGASGGNFAGIFLQVGPSGQIYCGYGDNGGTGDTHSHYALMTTAGLELHTGNWYHLACVINSSTSIQIYQNGAILPTPISGTGGTLAYDSNPTTIGGPSWGGNFMHGKIRSARLYSGALSGFDVMSLFMSGL